MVGQLYIAGWRTPYPATEDCQYTNVENILLLLSNKYLPEPTHATTSLHTSISDSQVVVVVPQATSGGGRVAIHNNEVQTKPRGAAAAAADLFCFYPHWGQLRTMKVS